MEWMNSMFPFLIDCAVGITYNQLENNENISCDRQPGYDISTLQDKQETSRRMSSDDQQLPRLDMRKRVVFVNNAI